MTPISIRRRRTQSPSGRPAHGVTAWLAQIPHRTTETLVRHADPLADGKLDSIGQPVKPRIEYMGRAERRAYGRAHHIPTPPSALVTYRREP
jgi:hypothetical protein